MARKETVTMSIEELRRVSIVRQAISRCITQKKAAELIGISYRQTKRIVARVRKEGEKGIIHRLRGRRSNRKIPEEVRAKAMELYREQYPDFGPTLASEKLSKRDGIEIDHETLRRWLRNERKWDWQRRRKKHKKWRQRKDYFGEMVQIDGSDHDWLEGRGPKLVFMGYIDDATGKVFGRFYDYEGTMPAMDSFMRYIKRYGIPQSIYLDRHTTYKSPKKQTIEEQLKGEEPKSQFERAMEELGVIMIHAGSPQAKGRIERLFRTFQDRLIKEMRLAAIKSRNEANEFLEGYLPAYGERFSVLPAKEGDLHRKAPGKEKLKRILCMKTERKIGNDGVVRYNNRFYQLESVYRRTKVVIVEDRLDGSVHIRNNGTYLKYREIPPELMVRPAEKKAKKVRRKYIPPKDHPWRKFRIKNYANVNK